MFLFMIGLIIIFFLVFPRYQKFKESYQRAYIPELLGKELLDTKRDKEYRVLVLGTDFPDEGRIEDKRITSISIIKFSDSKVLAYLLNPEDYEMTQSIAENFNHEEIESLGRQIEDETQMLLNYYMLVDLDKLPDLLDNFPNQTFKFNQDYETNSLVIKKGQVFDMNRRLAYHLLSKADSETWQDYNQRQVSMMFQLYQNWLETIYNKEFTDYTTYLFKNIVTNIPFEDWLEICLKQLGTNHFEIESYQNI